MICQKCDSVTYKEKSIQLYSRILYASILKQPDDNSDILLLTLFSGFELFVDLTCWKVRASIPLHNRDSINFPLDSLGWTSSSDVSGRVVALTSSRSQIKFLIPKSLSSQENFSLGAHGTTKPRNKVYSDSHVVHLEASVIYHSCFLPPIKGTSSQYLMFVTLYLTHLNEIKTSILGWWSSDPLNTMTIMGRIPINPIVRDNIPLFMIPIYCDKGAFILLTKNSAILITVNDVISASLQFSQLELCESPVAYFQEQNIKKSFDAGGEYSPIQRVYFATESNTIYSISIDMTNSEMKLDLFIKLPIAAGSSLLIFPCDSEAKIDQDIPIEEASNILVHTSGNGVIGGNVFISQDEESNIEFRHLSCAQFWGPISNGLELQTPQSFLHSDYKHDRSELFMVSSSSPDSWSMIHLRSGIRAVGMYTDFKLPKGSDVFTATTTPTLNLSDGISKIKKSFLLTTSLFGSQLYEISNNSMEIREPVVNYNVDYVNKTLAFQSSGRFLIQVTENKLIILDTTNPLVGLDLSITCEKIHIYNDYFLLVTEEPIHTKKLKMKNSVYHICVYHFIQNKFPEDVCLDLIGHTTIPKNHLTGVTVAHIIPPLSELSSPFILIGTSGITGVKLEIFTINENKELIRLHTNVFEGFTAINDITSANILDPQKHLDILIGMRDGTFYSAEWIDEKVSIKSKYKIGDSLPVRFFKTDEKIYATSDLIYKINNNNTGDYSPQLITIDENYFDSPTSACIYPLPNGQESTVAIAFRDKFAILDLDDEPKIFTRSICLAGLPRSVIYLTHLRLFAVLYHMVYSNKGQSPSGYLHFIDTSKGYKLKIKREDFDNWKPSKHNSKFLEAQECENYTCIMEWTYTLGKEVFKYLVVGSGYGEYGYIYILDVRIKKTGNIEVKKRFSKALENPACYLAQLDNSTIICATNQKIELFKLIESNRECQLQRMETKYPQSSPIRKITVKGKYVYILSMTGPTVYEYKNDELIIRQAEDQRRLGIDQTVLEDNTLMVSDGFKNVSVFGSSTYTRSESSSSLSKISVCHFPTTISKIIPVNFIRNPYLEELQNEKKENPSKHCDFLALGTNGSIFMLSLLENNDYQKIKELIYKTKHENDWLDFEEDGENSEESLDSLDWKERKTGEYNVIDIDILQKEYPSCEWFKNIASYNPLSRYY